VTGEQVPVIKLLSSLAKKAMTLATSSGRAMRPTGKSLLPSHLFFDEKGRLS
jgi:hypothetical protein